MDLEFSDEEAALRDNVRDVLAGICPPSVVRAVYERKGDPPAVWERMVELYWPALAIPEEHGGLGMGFLEVAIVAEELGRATVPSPYLATVTQFAPAIVELGGDAPRADLLEAVASGQLTGTLAIAERGRWGLNDVKTTATPGANGWVLDGTKDAVFDGASADEIVVVARGADGLGAFLVPRSAATVQARSVVDPTLPIADLVLDGVEVSPERVLAEPGRPGVDAALERVLGEATVALAMATIGTCRVLTEQTIEYAKLREQYGRPIGSFQALKHRMADMYLAVERASSLCWYAALTIAEDDPRRAEAAHLAKAAVGECQHLVVGEALQLHGGVGFTWEHDLHFLLKRAKAGDALFGNALSHRSALARSLGLLTTNEETARVKLTFGPDVEAFREEFLAWVAENRPTAEEIDADPALSSAHIPGWAQRWTRRMFDAGWLVPGWPPERGGRNAGPIESLICQEELTRAHIPRTTNPQGLGIVAPSIFDYGSPEQIRDYAEPIMRGEKAACLGMSEPGAGSDLASLSTRAVLDGDRFIINGQKVWTSGANYADFCFLFCRTDTTVAKHKGISVILVEMDTPGITVRPLPEIVGPEHPDLNEVFFDDVVVPAENLVGQLNNGWAMANGSLAHERGMVWLGGVLQLEETMTRVLDEAPAALERMPHDERAVVVDQLMSSYVDSVAARCLGYRGFAKLMHGGTAPEQALMKAFSSESLQNLALVASEMTVDDAVDAGESTGFDRSLSSWFERYLGTFGGTISAGSSEIQRNIVAEKVLGLPRS